jgi:hypothetical protein
VSRYLVEAYVPRARASDARAAGHDARTAVEQLSHLGSPVHYVRTNGQAPARSRSLKGPVRRGAYERQRERAPAPPAQQPTAEAEVEQQLPSGFRRVGPVPLWGDSDGWPRTPEEHAERDAHYTARRDLTDADRYDYTTVVKFGRQTAAEKRALSQEQKRSRELARAKRTANRDP